MPSVAGQRCDAVGGVSQTVGALQSVLLDGAERASTVA